MAEVTYKGKTFEVDEDGFLLKFDEWCPEWLEYVKESEGITDLNEDHQKILDFLQDYYRKNGIAPMVRILSKNTGYKLKEVYELFPSGPGKGACKMALSGNITTNILISYLFKPFAVTPFGKRLRTHCSHTGREVSSRPVFLLLSLIEKTRFREKNTSKALYLCTAHR